MDNKQKDAIVEAFTPTNKCSVCGSEYDEDEGGIQGHFGIMPVTFCVWCYSSILDMVQQADVDYTDNP
jgi:hypothetical protein